MIVKYFFITKYDYSKNKRVWFKKLYVVIDEYNLFKIKTFSNYDDAKTHQNLINEKDIIIKNQNKLFMSTVSNDLIPQIPMEKPNPFWLNETPPDVIDLNKDLVHNVDLTFTKLYPNIHKEYNIKNTSKIIDGKEYYQIRKDRLIEKDAYEKAIVDLKNNKIFGELHHPTK